MLADEAGSVTIGNMPIIICQSTRKDFTENCFPNVDHMDNMSSTIEIWFPPLCIGPYPTIASHTNHSE